MNARRVHQRARARALPGISRRFRWTPAHCPRRVDGRRPLIQDNAAIRNAIRDSRIATFANQFVWGHPTEAFLAAITRREFAAIKSETRLVQVGETAAPTITLPAAVLRSTALTILGTAGIPPQNVLLEAFQQVMAHAAKGELHIETERVPLADIENAWQRDQPGRRLVIIP